ncbi:uncharacterized protein [Palaemon carinicauda]|uniref:uncharacterized protein n=1 Tax=Palaemon carinicauda TaxID=392227 RepID=UPI0035B59A90
MWLQHAAEPWTVEVIRSGYRIPFTLSLPPLIRVPIPLNSCAKESTREFAHRAKVQTMLEKDALQEDLGGSPGFYSRLFLVKKASRGWRPVMYLSALNRFVEQTPIRIETSDTVRQALRPQDSMCTLDLKGAYLQISIHPSSRKYLRFMFNRKHYQFRELCFRFSTATQVFTRVFALVSSGAHRVGIRLLRYLDDWLILADSEAALLRYRDEMKEFRIERDSTGLPQSGRAPAQYWLRLLAHLSSLTRLVPISHHPSSGD